MKNFITVFLVFVMHSCSPQNSTYNTKAVELNNQAIDLIATSYGDEVLLNKALKILDDAIKLDSSYYVAYQSKATIFCKLKKYDSAIKTLDKVVKLRKNTAEILSTQGFLLEKIGNTKEAMEKYQAAFSENEQIIKEHPNKVEFQVNNAFLLIFLVNKITAQKNIENILQKYPDDNYAKALLSSLNTFDRKEYISSFCQ